jgi:drug/metabolite transporter (DMT)-like permease
MPLLGEAAALGSALSWGVVTVLTRLEGQRIDILLYNAIRASFSSILTLAVLLLLGIAALHEPEFGPNPLLGVLFLVFSIVVTVGAGDSLYFLAIQRIGVARAMPIASSHPLLTTVLAVLLLGEHITLGLVGGLILIPSGLYLVTRPARGRIIEPSTDTEARRVGLLMATAAAVLWACAAVAVGPGLKEVDPLTAAGIRTTAGALSVWVVVWRSGRLANLGEVTPSQIRRAFGGGLLTAGGHFMTLLAVSNIGVGRTAALSATAPLYAIPLSVFLLGEKVTVRMAFGALLSVIGVIVTVTS